MRAAMKSPSEVAIEALYNLQSLYAWIQAPEQEAVSFFPTPDACPIAKYLGSLLGCEVCVWDTEVGFSAERVALPQSWQDFVKRFDGTFPSTASRNEVAEMMVHLFASWGIRHESLLCD